jgi:ubiquinone/menaquinone biosynthesis C-methylase UbiE
MKATEYDRVIRTFIPGYGAMLAAQLQWLATAMPETGRVVDLGGGTGALAQAVAERFPRAEIHVWDVDPRMLAVAEARLRPHGDRIALVQRSFHDPLPEAHAFVASIALHHVRERARKTRLYAHVFESLRPAGIFLNADCVMNGSPTPDAEYYRAWEAFMGSHGISPAEAQRHFAAWAEEDRYFSIAEELRMLSEAGFPFPDCFWKQGAFAVYGGYKAS